MLSKEVKADIAHTLIDDPDAGQILGEGGFGITYKVGDFVVKKMDLSDIGEFNKEVAIWTEFSSIPELKPYIPEFLGSELLNGPPKIQLNIKLANTNPEKYKAHYKEWAASMYKPNFYGFIFQTYVPVMSMDDFLGRFNETQKFGVSVGVPLFNNLVSAFDILHKNGYIHRDIKPGNILIRIGEGNDITKPLIIDFGLVCKMPCEEETACLSNNNTASGTPYYLPVNMVAVNERNGLPSPIFPVKPKGRSLLNTIKNTLFCRSRKTRKGPNSIKVATKNIKVKGLYNIASDNYALGLVLEELYNVIYWDKNKAEKVAAQTTISRLKSQIVPYLAAQTAKKFSSA